MRPKHKQQLTQQLRQNKLRPTSVAARAVLLRILKWSIGAAPHSRLGWAPLIALAHLLLAPALRVARGGRLLGETTMDNLCVLGAVLVGGLHVYAHASYLLFAARDFRRRKLQLEAMGQLLSLHGPSPPPLFCPVLPTLPIFARARLRFAKRLRSELVYPSGSRRISAPQGKCTGPD